MVGLNCKSEAGLWNALRFASMKLRVAGTNPPASAVITGHNQTPRDFYSTSCFLYSFTPSLFIASVIRFRSACQFDM